MTVRHVILASEADVDLVKWEKDVASAPAGSVIYAPGMSLAAHQCVHGVVNGIPVVTTFEPVVGSQLKATGAPKWTAADWRDVARLIGDADVALAADVSPLRLNYDGVKLSLVSLHCSGYPAPPTDTQKRLMAYGVTVAAKALAAACIGEARHIGETSGSSRQRAVAARDTMRRNRDSGMDRDCFYAAAVRADLDALKWALLALSPVYRDMVWTSGYGGRKWADINAGARKLLIALSRFRKQPSAQTWAAVVDRWNIAVTREHNGKAPAFSKFGISKKNMDLAARWPLIQLLGKSCDAAQAPLSTILDGIGSGTLQDGEALIKRPVATTRRAPSRKKVRVSVRPSSGRTRDVYIGTHRVRSERIRRALDAQTRRNPVAYKKLRCHAVLEETAPRFLGNTQAEKALAALAVVASTNGEPSLYELCGVVIPGLGFHPVNANEIIGGPTYV